jgi:hypothetical protein
MALLGICRDASAILDDTRTSRLPIGFEFSFGRMVWFWSLVFRLQNDVRRTDLDKIQDSKSIWASTSSDLFFRTWIIEDDR